MASNYTPPQGNIVVVDGFQTAKKYPISANQRSYPSGTPMWLNKVSGGPYIAEPALLSTTNTTDENAGNASASTYGSVALANAAFAPLFLGFSAEQRIPQQLMTAGQFSVSAGQTAYPDDASKPFISVYDEGIAVAPPGPNLTSTGLLTANIEVGTLVYLDGFQNEETTGFYDPSGTHQVADTEFYLYMNAVTTTATAADAIGVVCERALIGQGFVKFKFKSYILGGVALG